MDKIISIIIATYNASRTLKKCLDSIIPQLSENCELIIIDGKSTDNTVEIIKSYSKYITYYISEKDKGIYDAWNKGIKKANGKWIMFIGSDDKLLPNSISSYLKIINIQENINTYDYICANNEYLDKCGKLIKKIGNEPKWSFMKKKMNAAHVASLHNKQLLFNTIGLYNTRYKICADYELLLRKKDKLKYLYLPNTIAQMQIGGMSFSLKAIIETYYIRKQHQSVSLILNYILLFKDWALFTLFILRFKIRGFNFN